MISLINTRSHWTDKEAIEYKDNVMKFKVKDGVFVRENEEDFYTIKNRLMGE